MQTTHEITGQWPPTTFQIPHHIATVPSTVAIPNHLVFHTNAIVHLNQLFILGSKTQSGLMRCIRNSVHKIIAELLKVLHRKRVRLAFLVCVGHNKSTFESNSFNQRQWTNHLFNTSNLNSCFWIFLATRFSRQFLECIKDHQWQ